LGRGVKAPLFFNLLLYILIYIYIYISLSAFLGYVGLLGKPKKPSGFSNVKEMLKLEKHLVVKFL
jgi:hypothetical protein